MDVLANLAAAGSHDITDCGGMEAWK